MTDSEGVRLKQTAYTRETMRFDSLNRSVFACVLRIEITPDLKSTNANEKRLLSIVTIIVNVTLSVCSVWCETSWDITCSTLMSMTKYTE